MLQARMDEAKDVTERWRRITRLTLTQLFLLVVISRLTTQRVVDYIFVDGSFVFFERIGMNLDMIMNAYPSLSEPFLLIVRVPA